MTTREKMELIDTERCLLTDRGLHVPVRIHDVKEAYGSIRVEITPIHGTGSAWVNLESLHETH